MSSDNEEGFGSAIVFLSGAIVGVAAALWFVRIQNSRSARAEAEEDDYYIEGGDIFI